MKFFDKICALWRQATRPTVSDLLGPTFISNIQLALEARQRGQGDMDNVFLTLARLSPDILLATFHDVAKQEGGYELARAAMEDEALYSLLAGVMSREDKARFETFRNEILRSHYAAPEPAAGIVGLSKAGPLIKPAPAG